MNYSLIAKTFSGLEDVLAVELENLGAANIETKKRAVAFEGDKQMLYKANLYLRTALKILKPIHTFSAFNAAELYNGVNEIDWLLYLNENDTFAIDSVANTEFFNHSGFVSLKVKDAIVDQIRKKRGCRPSVDIKNPDIRIHIHINRGDCTILLDSSGEPLFKRGYRARSDIAPINEVLAAGMILLSNWDMKRFFIDPMCGSGTIPLEAAMIAQNIPPCFRRENFGFMAWKDFDLALWTTIQNETDSVIQNAVLEKNFVMGTDMSYRAIKIARKNKTYMPGGRNLNFEVSAFQNMHPQKENGIIIMNPPYGERMAENDINTLYKTIGDTLKNNFCGYDAWIISSNEKALKNLGLHPSKKYTLYNGALKCKYLRYSIYEGSKKRN